MRQLALLFSLSLFFFQNIYALAPEGLSKKTLFRNVSNTDLNEADSLFDQKEYSRALPIYERALKSDVVAEKSVILKKIALGHAALFHPKEATKHLESFLINDFKTSLIQNEAFDTIRTSEEFVNLADKYEPGFDVWSFIYLYVSFIGFYIAIIINFNRKIDRASRILISAFIFIHSFFILNICFNITNYQFEYPHTYLMSTMFSFLYGPLLYFYLKRITEQYKFKKIDLLHLIPTVLILIYIIPVYSLSAEEKLGIMVNRASEGYNPGDSNDMLIVVALKIISLLVYGYFIRRLYLKTKSNQGISETNKLWQNNIYKLHFLYIIAYAIYGVLIVNHLSSGVIYHSQIICMSLMVLYIGYSAYVQPNVFDGLYTFDNRIPFKYEKSGLTPSLSMELKEQLIELFDEEKIYKESHINLERLADLLNTTRHNASQVINEHFKVSFHELINAYRIQEAKEILYNDSQRNLNIIDIAYEVGYNNKVTFNKAFKKATQQTPSEFQKFAMRAQQVR